MLKLFNKTSPAVSHHAGFYLVTEKTLKDWLTVQLRVDTNHIHILIKYPSLTNQFTKLDKSKMNFRW